MMVIIESHMGVINFLCLEVMVSIGWPLQVGQNL